VIADMIEGVEYANNTSRQGLLAATYLAATVR